MGNAMSMNQGRTQFENFFEVVDYIATYYILTMDFKSLSKLSEKDYCNKIILLTRDIIDKNFNDIEVEYLQKRTEDGVPVEVPKKEHILFMMKSDFKQTDKMQKCTSIAKFYVQIAHIFAAILMTINPVYRYRDAATGQMKQTGLLEKDTIPKNVSRSIHKFNICDNRLRSLKRGQQYMKSTDTSVVLFPKICTLNYQNGELKDLEDEPGMKELKQLYMDDNFDRQTGQFTSMSSESAKQFKQDLERFYKAFTGNDIMPPEYTKFSDIKLRDYQKDRKGCQGENAKYKKMYQVSRDDDLFIQYAQNIKEMTNRATRKQQQLLKVIDNLFSMDKEGRITTNPKLNKKLLESLIVDTRKIIIDLYIQCETDYVNGLKIYESIVESKILDTTVKQIENLKKDSNRVIEETKKMMAHINEDSDRHREDVQLLNKNILAQRPPVRPLFDLQKKEKEKEKVVNPLIPPANNNNPVKNEFIANNNLFGMPPKLNLNAKPDNLDFNKNPIQNVPRVNPIENVNPVVPRVNPVVPRVNPMESVKPVIPSVPRVNPMESVPRVNPTENLNPGTKVNNFVFNPTRDLLKQTQNDAMKTNDILKSAKTVLSNKDVSIDKPLSEDDTPISTPYTFDTPTPDFMEGVNPQTALSATVKRAPFTSTIQSTTFNPNIIKQEPISKI